MNIDQFNEEFYPFHAEFGYRASGSVPDSMKETFNQNLIPEPGSDPDIAFAIALEHSTPSGYFVRLFWRSNGIDDFVCSEEQYDQETLPQTVIEATKTY